MKYVFIFSIILIFSGCAGGFNPYQRVVVYKEGNAYYIPHDSIYMKVNASMINYGLPCRIDDTFWVASDQYNQNDNINQIMLKMFEGYAGCSASLTQAEVQQIQYYEAVKIARERAATQAAINNFSSSVRNLGNKFNQMSNTLSQSANSLSNYNQMQQLNNTLRDGLNNINQSIINGNRGYFGGGGWYRR